MSALFETVVQRFRGRGCGGCECGDYGTGEGGVLDLEDVDVDVDVSPPSHVPYEEQQQQQQQQQRKTNLPIHRAHYLYVWVFRGHGGRGLRGVQAWGGGTAAGVAGGCATVWHSGEWRRTVSDPDGYNGNGFAQRWQEAGLETNTPERVAEVIEQVALDESRGGECVLVSTCLCLSGP
ncbi:hypothetical protein BO70DRAFT_380456 [Aspergillus heteromorphus CBS 117.55]|uniref:Uncharacterized protein n=1 Tax=Aspergillus heteromorphus CBS 117.55 TaxID=1448321 RepID=A0A317VY56_9EURO|nr:uncharacterized protein BO70DRAFT_380456 [Aspergillus heteromorphus CBS 117.55]PWY79306.1 hypothetical protein BO70DRAFT_380456 [Aspergillus heteromorphus CBS 117.55]